MPSGESARRHVSRFQAISTLPSWVRDQSHLQRCGKKVKVHQGSCLLITRGGILVRGKAMDWARFEHHGESSNAAFEAFVGQLFERFCRREHGDMLREVRFVHGAGGDGGVDAYAVLSCGNVVGLQAKWFRDAFGSSQIDQIDKSFRTAVSVQQKLTRYCVAIPRKLGDDRTEKLTGHIDSPRQDESGKPKRPRQEKSQRERWNEWMANARARAPHVTIELWDEAKIENLLAEPYNEGLHAYWFSHSVFTLEDLKRRFKAAKDGWLHERYVPDLHATGELERDLARRLGESEARAKLLRDVRDAKSTLEMAHDAVARLDRYPAFMTRVPDAQTLRRDALEGLRAAADAATTLEHVVGVGERLHKPLPVAAARKVAVELLHRRLSGEERRRLPYGIDEIRMLLGHCVTGIYPAFKQLLDYWELWRNATTKLAAYTGRPGVGKTEGLAHAVESRLERNLPAVLLRAKECPVQGGWPEIFRRTLDAPVMRLDEILNALEATAIRADVRRLRSPGAPGMPTGIENEATCFLLAIDGLEESAEPSRWAELLGELASHLDRYPRIRGAVSLRTSAHETILGRTRTSAYDEYRLSEDGDVQGLLPKYCEYYQIPLPERRLRWAIRNPLSLRLFCDLSRKDSGWVTSRRSASLTNLFKKKLKRAEEVVCAKWGISPLDRPLQHFLGEIAKRYVTCGAPRREAAIEAAHAAASHRVSREQWSQILDHAEQEGLLLTTTRESGSLLEPPATYVEPANEALVDYLLAEATLPEVQQALQSGGAPDVLRRLARRPDAITQAAVLLAGKGIDLLRSDLWPTDLGQPWIDTWVLRSVAAMDEGAARQYREWVHERLLASMPSCRRVLVELCIPVARDETHAFGPRFVHDALLPFLPAKRDLFWSGPRDLQGDDPPWAGPGVEAPVRLKLESDDTAEGPPLLLGWALTSIDDRWRRRLRAELAQWGAGQLEELIRWLDLVFETNDPQMAEDAAMVAFGAACLAGANPRLAALAQWVDTNLLAPDARRRRENIVVLHAARGVVERANVMGIPVSAEMLEHARTLYSTAEETLPIDAQAAKEADEYRGISPVTGDLAWYVVPIAIEPFFRGFNLHHSHPDQDPRAERVLALHAQRTGLDSLSPQKFAFGVVMEHLHAMGWQPSAHMNGGIRYELESHGRRSPVCTIHEKYVWTARHVLQAYLAARAPVHAYAEPTGLVEPPVDPVLVDQLLPNPVSEVSLVSESPSEGWTFWPDDGLVPTLDLHAAEQTDQAIEWVRRAPEPDLRPWLILPRDKAPRSLAREEWVTLRCFVKAREDTSQAESILRVSAAAVSEQDVANLRSGAGFRGDCHLGTAGRYLVRGLSELCEAPQCNVYIDPSEAVWAPWAKGAYGVEQVEVQDASGDSSTAELVATTAVLTWEAVGEESSVWLPAHWLRRALGLVDAPHCRGAAGTEWHFMDRAGGVHAIYWKNDHSEALVMRRSSLEKALTHTGQTIVWPIWLFRWPSPSLLSEHEDEKRPYVDRHSEYLAFLGEAGLHVVPFPGSGSIESDPDEMPPPGPPKQEEPSPQPGSGVVQVGPTNPDLAVPLSHELDDNNAIPYFLWDDPMTVAEFRRRLTGASPAERNRLLGLLLREARDPDVWRFTTPEEVDARFDVIAKHLGRRKAFWEFLLNQWRKEGLLGQKSA